MSEEGVDRVGVGFIPRAQVGFRRGRPRHLLTSAALLPLPVNFFFFFHSSDLI